LPIRNPTPRFAQELRQSLLLSSREDRGRLLESILGPPLQLLPALGHLAAALFGAQASNFLQEIFTAAAELLGQASQRLRLLAGELQELSGFRLQKRRRTGKLHPLLQLDLPKPLKLRRLENRVYPLLPVSCSLNGLLSRSRDRAFVGRRRPRRLIAKLLPEVFGDLLELRGLLLCQLQLVVKRPGVKQPDETCSGRRRSASGAVCSRASGRVLVSGIRLVATPAARGAVSRRAGQSRSQFLSGEPAVAIPIKFLERRFCAGEFFGREFAVAIRVKGDH
jgi:hypothetical protein